MPAGAVEKYFPSRNYWTALLHRMKRIRGRKHGDISCSLRICPTPVIWISSNETFVFAAPHLFISLCLPWAPLLSQTKWLAGYFTFCSWAKTAVFPNMCGRNCFMINIQFSNQIQDWPLCVGLSENVKKFLRFEGNLSTLFPLTFHEWKMWRQIWK